MPEWNTDTEAVLTKLWNEGLSASQISGRMTGFSRNAVIGKVHRMKLTRRRASYTPGAPRAPRAARKPPMPPKQKKPHIRDHKAFIRPEIETAPLPVAANAWEALPGTAPVPLERLERNCCKWPIGEDAPFLFCGAKTIDGKSYCRTHGRRSVGSGTVAEQNAVKSAKRVGGIEHFAVELVEG